MVPMGLTLTIIVMMITGVNAQQSFYDLKAKTIDGGVFEFATLKGKKVMIVNTASKCGLTPQFEGLETLHKKYGGDNFVILGFPSNDFLGQDPGTNQEIYEFCTKNYGVSFTMMEKIVVKGDNVHPVYQWLTKKSKNGVMDSKISWNFQKYLIDENGRLIEKIDPRDKPDDPRIIAFITGN